MFISPICCDYLKELGLLNYVLTKKSALSPTGKSDEIKIRIEVFVIKCSFDLIFNLGSYLHQ